MPTIYPSSITAQTISEMVAVDPKVKGELYAAYLERSAAQHNAFQFFTSATDSNGRAGGVRSIFAEKTDLKASGADTVNFQVVGPPGGPGVQGNEVLSTKLSKSIVATYPVRVGWHRDGFALTLDEVEFLAAGKNLQVTILDLLSQKMGILKQNHQMMRLITAADGNVFRPFNRTSTDKLRPGDTLALAHVLAARARARTQGAQPLFHQVSPTGSPIDGYLVFASDAALLPIRNTDAFNTAAQLADIRGGQNAMFTGELLKWQGMPWYEFPVVDQPWDDYLGCPILAKAKIGYDVGAGTHSSASNTNLVVNLSNEDSRYFQFMGGYDWKFTQDQSAATPTGKKFYAWIVNPDGSVGFVEWTDSQNNGNVIQINKILSKNGAGTTTKGATTVGDLTVNTDATPDVWVGGNSNLPTTGVNGTWTYTDEFKAGAMVLPANSRGTCIGRSFVFGAMASCFANGRIAMSQIEQKADFEFTVAKGFQMIFGTGVTTNPLKKPVGYLLVEHAVTHEGFPVPVITLSTD